MTKSIAVSDLDSHSWYLSSEQAWPDYAARLLRRQPPSVAMSIGTDLHSAIQDAARIDGADEEPWFTRLAAVNPRVVSSFEMPEKTQLEALPLKGASFEVPVRLHVDEDIDTGEPLVLRGYIDALTSDGHLWELKTTRNSSGWVERYSDSWQWRAYAAGRNESGRWPWTTPVHYAVFFVKYDEDDVEEGASVKVKDIAELELLPYEAMAGDVRDFAVEFASFVDEHLPAYWRRNESSVKSTPLERILADPHSTRSGASVR